MSHELFRQKVRPRLGADFGHLPEKTWHDDRVLQRKAYGFREAESSKLKICGLHETRYERVGQADG